MVDVSWLGETNDRMDENVSLTGTSSTNSEFSVSAMHRISGLESNNSGPAKLVEVKSQFCWGIYFVCEQDCFVASYDLAVCLHLRAT
jgi:hypothetical protein